MSRGAPDGPLFIFGSLENNAFGLFDRLEGVARLIAERFDEFRQCL